jgi:hypothetical protein
MTKKEIFKTISFWFIAVILTAIILPSIGITSDSTLGAALGWFVILTAWLVPFFYYRKKTKQI